MVNAGDPQRHLEYAGVKVLPLVLASASPRRRALLRRIVSQFDVDSADLDETRLDDEPPEALALRLAAAKAVAVAGSIPGAWVLGADTVVAYREPSEAEVAAGWHLLGKPGDPDEAAAFLRLLGGREHRVTTAIALARVGPKGEVAVTAVAEHSAVWLRRMGDEEIAAYVATGSPMDKAGGYAIQDAGFRPVERIVGSETNVVGLPIRVVARVLREVVDPQPSGF